MSIEGFRTVTHTSEVNVSDHIGASVKALGLLGLVKDQDRVTEFVTNEYHGLLSRAGKVGEAYIQLPRSLITLEGIISTLDNAPYSSSGIQYSKTYVNYELWDSKVQQDGYKAEELDNLTLGGNGDFAPHARLAVYNPANEEEPLLHFLYKPFDKLYAKEDQHSQLEAIDEAINLYQDKGHEDFAITPLNVKALAFIALVRRIKGEKMPMTSGYMQDATLPRKTVSGYSVVGCGFSNWDEFFLHWSNGSAVSGSFGVGLSVGPKKLQSSNFLSE